MIKKYLKLLGRPSEAIIHFSDVFTEQNVDFDSELTAIFRNLGTLADRTYAIGGNPRLGDYGANLLNDLIEERRRIIGDVEKATKTKNYSYLKDKALMCVLNCAPRNKETTKDGKNGKDFHLAITDNGLEIYVVPVERLQVLESRNKILALYRIPNEKHKFFNGEKEQFRSSVICTSRYCPEILETVFEYKSVEDLIEAKNKGVHPQLIPQQEKLAEVAFSDKFGNIRLSVRDTEEFEKRIEEGKIDGKVKVRIGKSRAVIVNLVSSLAEIPEGELGLYKNVADKVSEEVKYEYWELVKKSKDPNNDRVSARDVLRELSEKYREEELIVG